MLFSASFYICDSSFILFFFAGSINTSKSELFHNQDRLFQTFLLFPISLFYHLIVLKIPLFSMQVSIFSLSSYSQILAQLNFKVTVLENNTWILDSEDFIITGMPLYSVLQLAKRVTYQLQKVTCLLLRTSFCTTFLYQHAYRQYLLIQLL